MGSSKYKRSNLLVNVDAYIDQAASLKKLCNDIEEILGGYIANLTSIQNQALKSGATAEEFAQFVGLVCKLQGIVGTLGKDISKSICGFITDIDTADDSLYPREAKKYLTDDDFTMLLAVVDKTPELSAKTGNQWIENLIQKFIKFLLKLFKFDTGEYITTKDSDLVKRMKETKELVGEKVMTIKINVRKIDRQYQRILGSYNYELLLLERALCCVCDTITPKYHDLTSEKVNRLSSAIKTLDEYNVNINKDQNYVADEQVWEFANNNANFFKESNDTIRVICENSVAAFLVTDFDRYRTAVKELRAEFDKVSVEYIESKEKFDQAKKKFDGMLKLYKEYGSSWRKHFSGDESDADMFDKLTSQISKVSKDVDEYIDIWYQMFFDMTLSKEALERYKASADCTNENVALALQRITDLYNKELDAYCLETVETFLKNIMDKGKEKAADILVKSLSEHSFVTGKFLESFFDIAFAEAPALAMYDTIEDSINKFNASVAKLKSLEKDSENYAEQVNQVRANFETARDLQIKFFKKLLETAEGQVARYYNHCVEALEQATLKDSTSIDFESQHEYYGGFNYLEYLINYTE